MAETAQYDQPDMSDVHAAAPLGPVRRDPSVSFFKRLRKNLRAKVSADDYTAAVSDAPAHAGGLARAAKAGTVVTLPKTVTASSDASGIKADPPLRTMRAAEAGFTPVDDESAEPPDLTMLISIWTNEEDDEADGMPVEADAPTVVTVSASEHGPVVGPGKFGATVFSEVAFAEIPTRVPVLPKPGSYRHPTYGALDFSREYLDRIIANFNDGAYQGRIPIDAEHDLKAFGALGYLNSLETDADGVTYGDVEWTDLGRRLMADNRFKYVSPEIKAAWKTPHEPYTDYRDVLIGLAATTRPFFKETSMARLAASEADTDTPDDRQEASAMAEKITEAAAPAVAQFTEADLKQFREQIKSEVFQEFTDAINEKDNRIGALERASQLKRFGETAGEWVGPPDDHVATLTALTKAYGEDSDEVQTYKRTASALSTQAKASAAFKEVGSGRAQDVDSPEGKITQFSEQIRKEQPALTAAQAYAEACKRNPDLYAAALKG